MKRTHYPTYWVDPNAYKNYHDLYEVAGSCKFYSVGKSGRFEMRVIMTRLITDQSTHFNLAFGVWDKLIDDIDDRIEVKNDDTEKILATVGFFAVRFLTIHPDAEIFAEGSTASRTRLYQREIGKIIDQIPPGLRIEGLIRDPDIGFMKFRKGVNFDAFLLTAG